MNIFEKKIFTRIMDFMMSARVFFDHHIIHGFYFLFILLFIYTFYKFVTYNIEDVIPFIFSDFMQFLYLVMLFFMIIIQFLNSRIQRKMFFYSVAPVIIISIGIGPDGKPKLVIENKGKEAFNFLMTFESYVGSQKFPVIVSNEKKYVPIDREYLSSRIIIRVWYDDSFGKRWSCSFFKKNPDSYEITRGYLL